MKDEPRVSAHFDHLLLMMVEPIDLKITVRNIDRCKCIVVFADGDEVIGIGRATGYLNARFALM